MILITQMTYKVGSPSLIMQLMISIACFLISFYHPSIKAQTIENVVLTAEEQEWISQHPTLKVASDNNFPPITFEIDGSTIGFSVDYLNLVAQKTGLNIEYVPNLTREKQFEMLRLGQIDITHSVTQTPIRDTFLNFTTPYIEVPNVYFGRVGTPQINTFQDLVGKKIGVVTGWSSTEIYRHIYPELTLVEFDDPLKVLNAISAGTIDVFVNTLPVTNYMISKNFITGLEVVGFEFDLEIDDHASYRIAVRKDWPILIDILEKGMAAISEQEYLSISDKWQTSPPIANKINLSTEEKDWLSNNKIIKVAIDPTLAPYEFLGPNNEISGIAGAYLSKISEMLNVEFVWSGSQNWAGAINQIHAGEADMLSTAGPTEDRKSFLTFTDSYMSAAFMIFSRDGEQSFRNLEGLIGYKLVLITDFAPTEFIKRDFPDLEIIEVATIIDALHLVSTGQADAYVGDIPSTSYYIAAEGLTQIKVVGDTPYRAESSMAIRSDLPLLASSMQKALSSITLADKTEISNKWLALRIEAEIDYSLIVYIIIIAAVIIAIILIWSNSLRREVNHRKIIEKNLIKSQAKAEAGNRAKSQFLANMSHEIRTPMNAIIGFTDLMLTDKSMKLEHHDNLRIVKRSGYHLLSLLNDILDISKIEAGQITILESNFSPQLLFEDIYNIFNPKMIAKGLDFSVNLDENVPKALLGDKKRIHQILLNLIGNALKFTDKGSVEVSGKLELKNNKKPLLKLEVSDTGRGIKKNSLKRIFGIFEQTEEGVKQEDGTGLGLSLSRSFARAMGGDVKISSQLGTGTKLVVSLLVSNSDMENTEETETTAVIVHLLARFEKTRILIADDIEENILYLKTLLERVGFETRSCSNGKEAIEIAEEWLPELILMDALMPVMNGSNAIEIIRNTNPIAKIPIIVVSASILEKDIEYILDTGANMFLAKPILQQELLLAIKNLLPVEFEYEEKPDDLASNIEIDSEKSFAAISDILPSELITSLQEASSSLNVTDMTSLLDGVSKHDQQLANDIQKLMDNFEWQEIERILS